MENRLERFRERLRSAQSKRVEKNAGSQFRGLRELREERTPEPAFVDEPAQPVEVVPPVSILRWVLVATLIVGLLVLAVLL